RCHRNHTVLERPGRVHRVVLDVEVVQPERLAEVLRAHQRRIPGADVDRVRRIDRQEVLVPPEAGRARGDACPGHVSADRVVVVGDFDGPEAEVADVARFERVFAMTLATAKVGSETHAWSPKTPIPEGRDEHWPARRDAAAGWRDDDS